MKSISEHFSKSRGLLNSLEAINNLRALLVLFTTGAVYALMLFLAGVLGAQLNSGVVAGIMFLIAFAIGLCGLQAAGLIFMDQARGVPLRGFVDALLGGVFSALKLLGVLLIELAALAAWLIVLVFVFFVCKIPGLGPVLYAIAFPVAAAVTGLGLFAMFYIGNTIAAPSVWDGNGILATVSRLWVVSKQRGLAVLVSSLLLLLLTGFAAAVIFQIAFMGVLTTGAVSAPVLGTSMNLGGVMGMFGPTMGGFGEGGSGYIAAAGFGTMLLFAIGLTVPIAVVMLGSCLIYLQATEELDFDQAEDLIKQRMSDAKRRVDDAKHRAQQSMQRPDGAAVAAPDESHLTCPKCNATITMEDMFCGTCGHKIK